MVMGNREPKKYRVGRLVCGSLRAALSMMKSQGIDIDFEEIETDSWMDRVFVIAGKDAELVDYCLQSFKYKT